MNNSSIRSLRFALVAAGLAVAAPSFASVTPLCGDGDKHEDKTKSETKKDKEPPKKPTNPA